MLGVILWDECRISGVANDERAGRERVLDPHRKTRAVICRAGRISRRAYVVDTAPAGRIGQRKQVVADVGAQISYPVSRGKVDVAVCGICRVGKVDGASAEQVRYEREIRLCTVGYEDIPGGNACALLRVELRYRPAQKIVPVGGRISAKALDAPHAGGSCCERLRNARGEGERHVADPEVYRLFAACRGVLRNAARHLRKKIITAEDLFRHTAVYCKFARHDILRSQLLSVSSICRVPRA